MSVWAGSYQFQHTLTIHQHNLYWSAWGTRERETSGDQWQESHYYYGVNREAVVIATICNNYCQVSLHSAWVRFSWLLHCRETGNSTLVNWFMEPKG